MAIYRCTDGSIRVFTLKGCLPQRTRAEKVKKVNTPVKYGSAEGPFGSATADGLFMSAGDVKDVRTFERKTKKLVAQIYHHFSRMKTFGPHWRS